MDKTWISSNRLSREYENGVSEFVKFAVAHAEDRSRMICPCLGCCYGKRVDAVQLTLLEQVWFTIYVLVLMITIIRNFVIEMFMLILLIIHLI